MDHEPQESDSIMLHLSISSANLCFCLLVDSILSHHLSYVRPPFVALDTHPDQIVTTIAHRESTMPANPSRPVCSAHTSTTGSAAHRSTHPYTA